MMIRLMWLFAVLSTCSGFVVHHEKMSEHSRSVRSMSSVFARNKLPKRSAVLLHAEPPSEDPQEFIDSLSEERRENLFQSLLRDLQVEGTPLLGCDANQVHTLQAALWTTMAELSEQDEEQKACLVLESIPMSALQSFVNDFLLLKSQERLMQHMPELSRLSVSLVGKGVGPAVLVEINARTEAEISEKEKRNQVSQTLDETKCMAAMTAFVERVVINYDVCPYMKTAGLASPGPVVYRYSPTSDTCSALSSFWNCICELLASPPDELSSTVLSLPAIAPGVSREAHDRFAALTELISRSLCLYRGDDVFSLVHFHPAYVRDWIEPTDKPAYGQLPPQGWLRSMLAMNGNTQEAESLTDEQLELSNYQRRSPHTAVNILRVSQLEDSTNPTSIVDLVLPDGRTEKASGLVTYSRNAIRLASVGEETLSAQVKADIAIQES